MYRKEREKAPNLPLVTIESTCEHLPCDHHTTSEEWLTVKFTKKWGHAPNEEKPNATSLPQAERRNTLDLFHTHSANNQVSNYPASNKGLKFDNDKQPWYAMPLEILEPLADVFRAGEKKYETFNCLKPFDDPARRFYDAMMRHMEAQQIDPLAKDPDTGCYHAAQIAFNALLRLYNCRKLQEKGELKYRRDITASSPDLRTSSCLIDKQEKEKENATRKE